MRYLGGKALLGARIKDAILAATNERGNYIEPFLGGGNSFRHIAPHFRTSSTGDTHKDLMLMWFAVRDGWSPPRDISEEYYYFLRAQSEPSKERGFYGFACAFGGNWGGIFSDFMGKGIGRYSTASAKQVLLVGEIMRSHNTTLIEQPYHAWSVKPGTVIYCDPPYADTAGYTGTYPFSVGEFWYTCDRWHDQGATVFVSEKKAPKHWKRIWGTIKRRTISYKRVDKGIPVTIDHEYLFTK
jgi:site-specific DNA-adenine methylase